MSTHIFGLLGAVVAGVSDNAWPTPSFDGPRKAAPREPALYSKTFPPSPSLILPLVVFCGGARLDLAIPWDSVACTDSIEGVATFIIAVFAIIECWLCLRVGGDRAVELADAVSGSLSRGIDTESALQVPKSVGGSSKQSGAKVASSRLFFEIFKNKRR